LSRDVQCTIDPDHYLVILKCSNNVLQNIPAEKLLHWLEKINKWAKFQNCTLLVVNPGSNNDKLFSLLMGEYRSLSVWQVSVTRPTVISTILHSGVMKKG
jgi:hypothetical protein